MCKCPLKKVTNLFCFEHRVNVCESCLLSNHSQCIVQTYLKWLQDSEYTPHCRLCDTALADHTTVRLLCLHVFHKHCLTKHAQSLPPTSAPASYTCLTCQEGVFPDPSNKSSIAEALRNSLATETWARPGLGLPVSSTRDRLVVEPVLQNPGPPQFASTPAPPRTAAPVFTEAREVVEQPPPRPKLDTIPVGVVTPIAGSYDRRVVMDSVEETVRPSVSSFDCDDDKYRRRSLREWLTRWMRLHSGGNVRDDPFSKNLRRWIVIFVISLFAFLTIILLMTRVNSDHAASDPFVNLGQDNKVQINPK